MENFRIDRVRVFNNALWTFAGQILPLVISLITLPLFIRCLGVERFGAFTLIIASFTYLNLLDLGIAMGLTRFLSKSIATGNDKESGELIETALLMLFFVGCCGAIVVFLILPFILPLLNIPHSFINEMHGALIILLVGVPVTLYAGGLRAVLNAHQRLDLVNTIDIIVTAIRTVGMLLIAIFINDLRWVLSFFLFMQIIAFLLYMFYSVRFMPKRKWCWVPDINKVWVFFQYGGWLTVSNIIGPFMVYFDRFLLGALLSLAVVPYYTVPYDLVTKLWVFPAAICLPFFPVYSALHSKDGIASKQILMKTVRFLFISLFPLVLFVFIFAREGLSLWVGPEFAQKSYIVLQWISVGVLINSLAQLIFHFILALGRTDILAKFHLMELCFYVPCLFFLIKKFGIEGAAMAWVLRVGIDVALLFIALIRLISLEVRYTKEIVNCIVLAIVLLVSASFIIGTSWKCVYWVGIVVLFTGWLWKFVMDKEDRLWVMGLMGQRLG